MLEKNKNAVALTLRGCFAPEVVPNGFTHNGQKFPERCETWAQYALEELVSEVEEYGIMLWCFEDLVKAYHDCVIPEDDAAWSDLAITYPNDARDAYRSITEVLSFFETIHESMSERILTCLGLPPGSTYVAGVKLIYADTSHRAKMPRNSHENIASSKTEKGVANAVASLEEKAFLKELADME
jgi:hypothetical protein